MENSVIIKAPRALYLFLEQPQLSDNKNGTMPMCVYT